MACLSKRPPRAAKKKPPPVPGAAGFLRVKYIGKEPTDQYGQVTRAAYPFVSGQERFVDRRDAVYILGSDFEVM